tara:strand:+ start:337 stop:684 length:348 start_codon:yes stop_codon:yes gene_type:complete
MFPQGFLMVKFFNNKTKLNNIEEVTFEGKKFHLSGNFDGCNKPEFAEKIKELGGECTVKGRLTKNNPADYLVIGDQAYRQNGHGQNERTADERGIPKITQSFCEKFFSQSDDLTR